MTDKLTLEDISDAIRALDICMMTTRNEEGALESRPMSNNKDVEYTGTSHFFTLDSTKAVKDLRRDPHVCLAYDGKPHLLAKHFYVCVSGRAELSQDRATLKTHWVPDLEAWFKQGLDTPGLTLITVRADHIKYWKGFEEGEVHLPNRLAA